MATALPNTSVAETRVDTYNGATCISYPPFNTNNGLPYQSWLYGFGQGAYCHFQVPDGWTVDDISYVLFEGSSSTSLDNIRVRLCVYYRMSQTCGAERTMSGTSGINWVTLPASMPNYVTGAYLSVSFPAGKVSTFQNFMPVWQRTVINFAHVPDTAPQALQQRNTEFVSIQSWRNQAATDFSTQPRSEAWAREKESSLRRAALNSPLPQGLIESLDCRQTQCRANTTLASNLDGNTLQVQLSNVKHWVESLPECQYSVLHDLTEKGQSIEVLARCDSQ